MKNPILFPFTAAILLATAGCDPRSPDSAAKIAELERKAQEALDRQLELERQLEAQRLTNERDAIEQERVSLEEERADLERQQGDVAAAREEIVRQREEELAGRERELARAREQQSKPQSPAFERGYQLTERERERAGREALPFQPVEQFEPVGDYGMFYDSLASHGSWFETSDYGYVWQPAVREANWRPYSRGRWVCSDRGWTWVSEEPFGWATYHYGRWALLRGHGWIWVPGSEWAPAWVSWREHDSYIGWAPLPPETLAYRGHQLNNTVDVRFGIGDSWFNFVEVRHFGGPVYEHCLPLSRNVTIIQQTVNITYIHTQNRQVICGGPRYQRISERLGRPMPFYRLEMDNRPRQSREEMGQPPRIRGDRMLVSAPNIDAEWNERVRPARVKGRMESITVERKGRIDSEVAGEYRRSREEGRRRAEASVAKMGGAEKFERARTESLKENRRKAADRPAPATTGGESKQPARPQRQEPADKSPAPQKKENTSQEKPPGQLKASAATEPRRTEPAPQPALRPGRENRSGQGPGSRPAEPASQPARPNESGDRQRQADETRKENARQEQANQIRKQQEHQKQEELNRQRQQQEEAKRQRQQQEETLRQQKQQEEARRERKQQEETQRQRKQQEDAQRERQQQEENQRQRQQQEENQRQRQQQEENQRQRQQQEENQRQRQQQERNDEDQRKRR